MNKALIDTDTLSFFLRGRPEVKARVGRYLAEHGKLNISVITYYEVLSGLKHRDARRQIDAFLGLVRANRILPLTEAACGHAASVYAALRKSGRAVDDIDLLIAGIALEQGLAVATGNVSHFSRIPGLAVEDWTAPKEE